MAVATCSLNATVQLELRRKGCRRLRVTWHACMRWDISVFARAESEKAEPR